MRLSVSLCLVLGALGLISRPARAQSGLNSKDLEDSSHGRPTSTQNLNQANTADERALAAEAAHVAHYYDPDWVPGALLPIKGEAQPVPGLRYNLVHHWVEVQDATVPGGVRLYPVGSLRGFVLNNAPGRPGHRFGAYRVGGAGRQLLEELTEGPVHLLLGYDLELVGAVRNVAIGVETQAAQFRRTSELYVATPARPLAAQPLALGQRAVLRLFG